MSTTKINIKSEKSQNISISKKEFKDFHDILIENTKDSNFSYSSIIKYCPAIFKLLCDLYSDYALTISDRWVVSSAIAYFVAPKDIISEEQLGAAGYIDDIFLSVFVLKIMAKKYKDIIEDHWSDNEDIFILIKEILTKTRKILGPTREEILKFAGLSLHEVDVYEKEV